jgi:hypothetical protein
MRYRAIVKRAFLWVPYAVFASALWLGAGAACRAGGAISAGVDPALTTCLSSAASCSSVIRTQLRLQYKPISIKGFSARLRLSRSYQITMDDDKDEGVSEERSASIFDPPYDVADLKLRFSSLSGRDRLEVRAGYAYQHSDPYASDGYHAGYLSGDYYFGPPIATGFGGASRRFDVLMKVSDNLYSQAGRPPEELDQFVTTYTVPINADGSTRMYASYARELRFSGSDVVRTPSNRLELCGISDPSRWLEFYARLSIFGTRGIPGAAKGIVGVDITV